MTIKEFAFATQQHLQTSVNAPVKRGHVYEFLAASFGFNSYAAFRAVALPSDTGVGEHAPVLSPGLVGRCVQLGYELDEGKAIAAEFVRFSEDRGLSYVRWHDLGTLAMRPDPVESNDDFDDWDDDWEDDPEAKGRATRTGDGQALQAEQLKVSLLLMAGLEEVAEHGDPFAHLVVAAIYRCARPNGYLYEEALKGRRLSAVEQRWADEYLQLKPQFEKYEHHLRRAAEGGLRAAALEYAEVFDSPRFFELAEKCDGPADPSQMLRVATLVGNRKAVEQWMRRAAETGDRNALGTLAYQGESWAQRRLAESGDTDAIRELAEEAIGSNPREAWMWHFLAKRFGVDLTKSTLNAYHDGGLYDGDLYDDDQGGSLYVAGNEGLVLPPISDAEAREARKEAHLIFARSQSASTD